MQSGHNKQVLNRIDLEASRGDAKMSNYSLRERDNINFMLESVLHHRRTDAKERILSS